MMVYSNTSELKTSQLVKYKQRTQPSRPKTPIPLYSGDTALRLIQRTRITVTEIAVVDSCDFYHFNFFSEGGNNSEKMRARVEVLHNSQQRHLDGSGCLGENSAAPFCGSD
ncbi:hypothetical protein Y032_0030g2022 [Ancylostoma ceylanicum]|uniref:Uncharacterized protein n=1 Tax=Ancylostoma ceylanicum TaxID=53326 RepID=A0A016URD6_9BILA|nr:hypothetical protein Y032_0030g2022 [Ancylostoma ceylanicum]